MQIQRQIESELGAALEPHYLEVSNESYMHAVPADSETHFRVTVVSSAFDGKRRVARHQMVYAVLREQMQGGVHALALHTYTGDEWQARQQATPESPQCLGGDR